MLFKDRRDAGQQLAGALQGYLGQGALILAVPRGGVLVAVPVVKALDAEMDLIIPRKVGLPANPEVAAAAVAPDGTVLYNDKVLEACHLTPADLQAAVDRELAEIKRRLTLYRGNRPLPVMRGRLVIIVDDGIATGLTIKAALKSVRKYKPRRLVLAVPVAPPDTLTVLRPMVEDLVCLAAPEPFYAVGQFYRDFRQVSDAEVKACLEGC
ncbi:phosphoribosyltransferase [Neomoorella thermoacetica]|uniref:Phosphoribosyl transferase n=2 Tax=Neomoorella thermoacetica TaxID=1525 RepID=A0A1D7XF39_NEOTH|nr:phosphoribosyltransferase [Moorella thermoacetica]AKX95370.1 putative phosphoribosyl transferasec [Moorella thermoacetica]AKX97994.1 putative phosphoribosyl transferasec [Moorella thermoacetica]AOQ25482.1 Putative phosphoribosyl transferase [Moorella thermoacetica]OIQ10173.1 putative phosphoribosyl transferasec [Moorella thermoacetica]OIQ11343.1 putative phosphoribosyl transferasec [Moorella thermoacetica]